jgi:hypothetical protein
VTSRASRNRTTDREEHGRLSGWIWKIAAYSGTALFGMLLLQPLADSVRGLLRQKPDVVVNITEVHQVNMGEEVPLSGRLGFMFRSLRGTGTMLALDTGDKYLNRKYGWAVTAVTCNDCTEYGFDVGNLGSESCDKVTIDVLTIGSLETIPETQTPKLVTANCTGEKSIQRGCHLEIASVSPREPVVFSLLSKGFGLRGATCAVDGCKDCCAVNFIVAWKKTFSTRQEAESFRFDFSNVTFDPLSVVGVPGAPGLLPPPVTPGAAAFCGVSLPPMNSAEEPVTYRFDFEKRKWTRLQ